MEPSAFILFFLAAAIVGTMIVGCSAYLYYGRIWFRAKVRGAPVPLERMVQMTFRGASAFKVVNAYVDATLAGLDIGLDEIESLDRARGRVRNVVRAMIAARQAGSEVSFAQASELDRQGKDFLDEVNGAT